MADPNKGMVNGFPLGLLLGKLTTNGFTGALRLDQDMRRFAVWFRGGTIVAAESAAPEDTVGRVALDAELIDPSAVGESIRRMAQTRKRSQYEVLIEMGAFTPESAARAMRMTLTRRALRLFSLPDATFAVEEGQNPPDDAAIEPLEPRWVVYNGLRQHYRHDRLERELGSLAGSAIKLAGDPRGSQESFGFSDDELVVLAYLHKGYWELEDLVVACLTLPRDAVLAVVYALLAFGELEVRPATAVPRLRKRPREATQEMDPVAALGNPRIEAPLADPVRPRSGVTNVGPPPPPPPSPSPPSRVPNGTGSNHTPRSTTGQVRAASPPPSTGPIPRTTGSLPTQGEPSARDSGSLPRAESPQPSASGSGPIPKVNRSTLDGTGTAGALREQIVRKLGQVEANADYFTILGVPRDATAAQIKSSYFQLAKTYHPDRLSLVKLEALRPQVERIFARLSEAYAVLSEDKRRVEYVKMVDSGKHGSVRGNDDEIARATKILGAEEHFRRGEMALRRQLFSLAEKEFRSALELNPEEGEHHAMAAWAQWCNADDKDAVAHDVKKGLNKAVELNQRCVPAVFYLGQLYKHMGDDTRAAAAFHKVLQLAPGHVDALREVRLLDMRRGDQKPSDKKSGFFDRFRKK